MLDSKTWKYIAKKWPKFVVDLCNIRLGLALDGVNLFGDLNSCHSTWPMVLLNYNLPPWLVTKRHFFKLALIIPGKESCTSNNVDVYLEHLIEKLQLLWKWVEAFDVYLRSKFTLKTMCIWSIHDFLTHNLFVGCVMKGHVGCLPCGLAIESCYSKIL